MSFCPDHSRSRWALDTAEDARLAIVTEGNGLGVLELGLRAGDDGYATMRRLAADLVLAHNASVEGRGEAAADTDGFAEEYWDEPWHLSSTSRIEPSDGVTGGRQVIASLIFAGSRIEYRAAHLGEDLHYGKGPEVLHAAKALVDFHNALRDAGGYVAAV